MTNFIVLATLNCFRNCSTTVDEIVRYAFTIRCFGGSIVLAVRVWQKVCERESERKRSQPHPIVRFQEDLFFNWKKNSHSKFYRKGDKKRMQLPFLWNRQYFHKISLIFLEKKFAVNLSEIWAWYRSNVVEPTSPSTRTTTAAATTKNCNRNCVARTQQNSTSPIDEHGVFDFPIWGDSMVPHKYCNIIVNRITVSNLIWCNPYVFPNNNNNKIEQMRHNKPRIQGEDGIYTHRAQLQPQQNHATA